MPNLVLAIDGPSGSGKSSTAKAIALRANWSYLDTGALYRAVTYLALEKKIESEDEIVKHLESSEIVFDTNPADPKIFVNDKDVSAEIRLQRINDFVSKISAMPTVRKVLLELQRKYIADAPIGIVVEGRDIGTVVAPQAQLKIYLHADIDARAQRRENEMIESIDRNEVGKSLASRDEVDSTRAVSPLMQAEDAAVIDSTRLSLQEVVDQVWKWLKQRNLLGLPTIAVIGRPNVGKSTLVNRMIGRREAIVEDTPGVTRDRVKYEAEWNGRRFFLIDTGGWEVKPEGISEKITAGAEAAIREADLVMFVVDVQVGALDEDQSLVDLLRKSGKKVILVGNKIDNAEDEADGYALWNLGLGEPRFVSALHGRGSGDLLDLLIAQLPEVGTAQVDDGYRRVALVGRPNVGKSTLVNDILYTTLANKLNGARLVPGRHRTVTGVDQLDKVVHVDQSPIGRTPRSNPATYTGVFDKVRALEPTHVIVNIDENTRESAERLAQCVPNLIVTHPLAPLDNPPLYRLLGGIFGRSAEAEALAGGGGDVNAGSILEGTVAKQAAGTVVGNGLADVRILELQGPTEAELAVFIGLE